MGSHEYLAEYRSLERGNAVTVIIDGVPHVDAEELYDIVNNPEKRHIYVVDVREPEEYNAGHIPGVPLLPMGQIPELIEQFDKNAEYIFICRSGNRSLNVAKYFQMNGIQNVHNYAGGMLAWDKEIAEGPEHVVESFSMKGLERKA